MVIGIIGLLTVTSIPTITGVGQAVSAQKRQNAASKEQEKFNLTATVRREKGGKEEEAVCYLKGGKIVLQFPGQDVGGHKFCGFHFKYPGEEQHLGLVSSFMDDPPMLNWIYVNRETGTLQHGGRKDTLGHLIGPWGWSDDERFLILRGSPLGFTATKEETKEECGDVEEGWVLHWDGDSMGDAVDAVDELDNECGKDRQDGCFPCKLNRRPLLGVDSSYVKDQQ